MAEGNDGDDQHLWRECAAWLTHMEILTPNHPVNAAQAQPFDLAQVLSDGVLLCFLARKLNPHCIDSKKVISSNPMPRFHRLKNLMLFLDACTDHFGISESDLFDPTSQYDSTDFGQVLRTLSILSYSTSAANSGISGFPSTGQLDVVEENYSILRPSRARDTSPRSSGLQSIYEQFSDFRTLELEPIYDQLVNPEDHKSNLANEDPIEKRRPVIAEIISTESSFLKVMKTVDEIFKNHLVNYLTGTALEFSEAVSKLVEIHSDFCNQLLVSSNLPELLTWLLQWSDQLLHHGQYVFKLKRAQETVNKLLERPGLMSRVKDHLVRQQLPANTGLASDLLLHPYQRVCRYPLLFKRLLEYTPEGYSDYSLIEQCIDKIKDSVSFIDQVKQNSDDFNILKDIREQMMGRVDGMDMDQLGNFLIDDEIRVTFKGSKVQYLYLFVKKLIFCDKIDRTRYQFSMFINPKDYEIQLLPTGSVRIGSWSYKWKLINRAEGDGSAIILATKSDATRSKWIDKLREAKEYANPSEARNGRHSVSLTTFPLGTRCVVCTKLFKGYYCQGYQCEHCSVSAHKECLGRSQACRFLQPELDRFPWYAGEMERSCAEEMLESAPKSTFLLRFRMEHNQRNYAITFVYGIKDAANPFRHLRIHQKSVRGAPGSRCFFLREDCPFPTLEKLVEWHMSLPLHNYFPHLQDCILATPWKLVLETAIVHADYSGQEMNTLRISEGQHVIVVNKRADDDASNHGWWVAKRGNKTGFIPRDYVNEWNLNLADLG